MSAKYIVDDFDFEIGCRLDRQYMGDLSGFSCGNDTFDTYLKFSAFAKMFRGDGVTYLVFKRENGKMTNEVIAYYTLTTHSINFKEEDGFTPSLYIKMFAVSEKYQSTLVKSEGKIVSELVLLALLGTLYDLSKMHVGFQDVVLHSVKSKYCFYRRAGFTRLNRENYPASNLSHSEEDCIAMFMPLFRYGDQHTI